MSFDSVVQEYYSQQTLAETKYGPKTVVWMQVGSFYEMYEFSVGKCHEIKDFSRLRVTRKNGDKPVSENNPYMCGVPIGNYESFIPTFLAQGYTIVIIDQIGGKPATKKEKFKRAVTQIIGPGTYFETAQANSNIVCLVFDVIFGKSERPETWTLGCGGVCINILTGETNYFEVSGTTSCDITTEIRRYLTNWQPNEIVIYTKNIENPSNLNEYLKTSLSLHKYLKVHYRNNIPKSFVNIHFQNEYFRGVYGIRSKISAIECLKLENSFYSRCSLIGCIEFCKECQPTAIEKIKLSK